MLGEFCAIEELLNDEGRDLEPEGSEVEGWEEEEGVMTNDAASKHMEDEEEMLGKERAEVEETKGKSKGTTKVSVVQMI